ncbi:hypothetical protein K0M31_019776 [Melipona bicolor]|uniref:Uncharacterized protein n=1 Tax=Melipona bicolor TaxID=60889 RepID=A0AA40KRR5_9HYME|nr:hypothetical protein K0M31_019776 [Melipona bicolor]
MGNLPIQIHNFRLVNAWTVEKKLLIWRTVALSACIVGTVVYMRPLEPYIEAPIFGILVPTFITGYMLIHSSDILLLTIRKDYMFLETWFVAIGAVGSLTCGIYQFYKWIEWVVNTSPDPNGDNNIPELVLALAFLLHFVCLCAVMAHRVLEWYQTREEL